MKEEKGGKDARKWRGDGKEKFVRALNREGKEKKRLKRSYVFEKG